MSIIVSGSLAYDRIMDFPGHFKDHILPDKIHVLNVCFQVNGMKEKFGGTAGNIAYALKLLGENPLVSAAIGSDHRNYFAWMERNGLPTYGIRVVEEEFTAGAFITTDQADNQITGFNPGAMRHSSLLDLAHLDPAPTMVVVSPGNIDDMSRYPAACRERGIPFIFDPGQSIPMLDAGMLAEAIKGCHILISNDYEMDLIMKKTGLAAGALLERAGAVIVTLGELGSKVATPEGEILIPAAEPRVIQDPTGAGDAYRGGLVAGLVRGRSLEEAALMGSACASFAVESYGTQEYTFTTEEFEKRLASISRG
jgi:adenosine kinase